MKVSVIVVTWNEENNIISCLTSLAKQDYGCYEIIIVDGGSTDKTNEKVLTYVGKKNNNFVNKQITIITEKGRTGKGTITECRNAGIKNAKYDYIAYTDADCIVPEDWLMKLAQGYKCAEKRIKNKLEKGALAGVGGANIPPQNATVFQQAIGIAFNSLLGSLGSIQAKPPRKDKQVFSISCCNALFRKDALVAVGMFSVDLENQGEDWDMGAKLNKAGFVVYGVKDSFVWHNFKATPKEFWKNMFFYGDGRMRLMKKHKDKLKKRYILPLLFIPSFIVSFVAFVITWNAIFLVIFAYLPLLLLYSVIIATRQKKSFLAFHVFLAFFILHFGYASGELKGLRWLFITEVIENMKKQDEKKEIRKNETKKFWEDNWSKHKRDNVTHYARYVISITKKKNYKTFLEIGAGSGADALFFAKHGYDVTATDCAASSVAQIQEKFKVHKIKNSIALKQDTEILRFKKEEFDIIYAHLSLHYFDDESTTEIFEKLYEILKKNGMVFIRCKATEDAKYGKGELVDKDVYFYEERTRHFFDEEYMKKKLQKFNIVSIKKTQELYHQYESVFIEAIATK